MPLFLLNFTQKVFEPAPLLGRLAGLQKLYPAYYQDNDHLISPSYGYPEIENRNHNKDALFTPYQTEMEILIGHFDKLGKEAGVEMSAALASLKQTLLFAYQENAQASSWQNQPSAAFAEIKHVLESVLIELIEAQEKQDVNLIKTTLSILAKQFMICPIGSPLIEGKYSVQNNTLQVEQYEVPGTPSLSDFVLAAPTLAYVYEGKVESLCNAYPPKQLGQIQYKRRPNTTVAKIHGQDNINAYQTYKNEFELLLNKFKILGATPGINCDMATLIENIRLNVFFPFEDAPGDRKEKLDDQDAQIFIDIKRKLETIYRIIDTKVKSKDQALIADVNTTLQEMVIDIAVCGPGFHELVTDVVDKEKMKKARAIDIPTLVAKARAEATKKIAQEHIAKHPNMHPGMHTHVGRYFLKIAERLGYNPLIDESQRNFNDDYLKNLFEDLKNYHPITNPIAFRDNSIFAAANDVLDFHASMAKHFNEKELIALVAGALEEKIRSLHAEYLKRFEREKNRDNKHGAEHAASLIFTQLTDELEKLLLEQKIPKSMVDLNHMIMGIFKPNHDHTKPTALADADQLMHALNIYAISMLTEQNFLSKQQNPDRPLQCGQFQITELIAGLARLHADYSSLLPESIIYQYVEFVNPDDSITICTLQHFFDYDLHLSNENYLWLLEKIRTPALLKQLIQILDQTIKEKSEECSDQVKTIESLVKQMESMDLSEKLENEKADLNKLKIERKLLLFQRRKAHERLKEFKHDINQRVLLSLQGPRLYGTAVIDDLIIDSPEDLYDFLITYKSEDSRHMLLKHLKSIPHLIEFIKDAYLSSVELDNLRVNVIMSFGPYSHGLVNQIESSTRLTAEQKARRYAFLATVYENETIHTKLSLDDIPPQLRLHLLERAVCYYMKTPFDVASLYRREEGNVSFWYFTQINSPKTLIKILEINSQERFLSDAVHNELTVHKDMIKLSRNIAYVTAANQHSDFQKGLVLESTNDILTLLNRDPNIWLYRNNMDPLIKFIGTMQFQQLCIDEYRVNGMSPLLIPIINQILFISRHSQSRNVHLNLCDTIAHGLIAGLLIPMDKIKALPAYCFPCSILVHATETEFKNFISRSIVTFSDWLLIIGRFQELYYPNPIPDTFLKPLFDCFDSTTFATDMSDPQTAADLLEPLKSLSNQVCTSLARRFVDVPFGLSFMFTHFKEESMAYYLPAMCIRIGHLLDTQMLPDFEPAHLAALTSSLIDYCKAKNTNLMGIMSYLDEHYWSWLLENLGLLSSPVDFSWINHENPKVRLDGLTKLFEADSALDKDAPPTPNRHFNVLTPVNRGERLRALVVANEDQYDAVKVLQILTNHYVMKLKAIHFAQARSNTPPLNLDNNLGPRLSFENQN